MEFLRKYGVATHIRIPVVKRAVVDDAVSADWTPAAGDVKISKDGGAAANVTNLPTAVTMGNTAYWDFSLTATEMQAASVVVSVSDSSTKVVEDQFFLIGTYGNASALHAVDFSDSTALGLSRLDAAVTSRMATYTQPTGFLAATFPGTVASTTNITSASGVALTAAYDAAKTAAQAGNAMTLTAAYDAAKTASQAGDIMKVSTGTGANQLDVTSGVIKANLAQILGTALTETAGQIAAAFKQFFNIASPTSTMNTITTVTTTTTATNLTNAPTAGDFTAAMKTSLNAATPAVTVSDKTGFALTAAYDAAKTAAAPGAPMALVADALDATAVAASGASEIAAAVATNAAATPLAANIKKINDVTLTGTGVSGDEWGP